MSSPFSSFPDGLSRPATSENPTLEASASSFEALRSRAAGRRGALGLADSGGNPKGEPSPALAFGGSSPGGSPLRTEDSGQAGGEGSEGRSPSNNMGGKSLPKGAIQVGSDEAEDFFLVRTCHNKTKVVRVPRPESGVSASAAFVDQVSFTFQVHDVSNVWFTDEDFAAVFSPILEEIFGYGVTAQRERGLNFYDSSFVLGDGWGFLCVGGQRETCLIQISGTGATAAQVGWETRLYAWLSSISSARITRVDLAHDIYDGVAYNVFQARDDYLAGRFNCGGRDPDCDQKGNWLKPEGKALTFYVGSRSSGKLLRVYMKGRQLGGDACELYPEWTRVELELHSEDRVIPLEILLKPGQYLAGSYPALAWISEERSRIETKSKALQVSYERAIEIVKNQCGRYLYAFRAILGSADAVLERLIRPEVPERLIMPDWTESPPSLRPPSRVSLDEAFALAFAGSSG